MQMIPTLMQSLGKATGGIDLYVNVDKTKYMCFNKKEDISNQIDGSLELMDKFTSLRSRVSFTENDINTRLTNAWTPMDRSSIRWKSDLSDKIKRNFFLVAVVSILIY